MVDYELTIGQHDVVWSKAGYADLTAKIDVGESAVSCVSVEGGSCGSTTPPGVVASGFTVTGYLEKAAADICSWITGLGGWEAIMTANIMDLVSGYLGVKDLGFTVTTAHIMGAVAYYLDNPDSGDTLTGCSRP